MTTSGTTQSFVCPECKRTVTVPAGSHYPLICPYCNCEMKAIVTED